MIRGKPVRSPIQPRQVSRGTDSMAQLAQHMGDFMRMYQEMQAAKEEILGTLSSIQKGERGVQGLPGIGRDGRDGRDGKNGAPGRNGLPGKDGKDGVSPRIEDVVKEVRKKKLETKDVTGLDQTLHAFKTQLDNRGGYIHGGGDTVGAGSGIVITEVNGVKIISSLGGFQIATEQLTPTQVGPNITLNLTGLSHTFSTILGVWKNGQLLTPGDPTFGWSRSGNIITVVNGFDTDQFLVQYTYA